jgi:hypothetical protein
MTVRIVQPPVAPLLASGSIGEKISIGVFPLVEGHGSAQIDLRIQGTPNAFKRMRFVDASIGQAVTHPKPLPGHLLSDSKNEWHISYGLVELNPTKPAPSEEEMSSANVRAYIYSKVMVSVLIEPTFLGTFHVNASLFQDGNIVLNQRLHVEVLTPIPGESDPV